jgi:glycyl-tRNA synthetase beta chain
MDRELLLEIGCEELPASWLAPLTKQLADRLAAKLAAFRLTPGAPIETFATPRRLTAAIARISERQSDLEEPVSGPPVSAAFGPDGQPTPAAIGFARKNGVEVSELERTETPKGTYLSFTRRERGKATVDVLPDVLAATLRELAFPKQMHWDAWLDDGRGELLFGRPIRWILFLHGGRVVPFVVRRSVLAQSATVQEVRAGAVTYGHRVLAGSGRAGRALKVRSIADYRSKLGENFVLLDREERQSRVTRELDMHARRLGGRVNAAAVGQSGLLQEVVDLMEYPTVVAGTFAPDFLSLPEEVLTTTMIHHQHYFPVTDEHGKLMPAFLAVTNIQTDNARAISVNSERVLTARLRDAQFFWDADQKAKLESKLERLGTLLFHKRLGSYRAKALRLEQLAGKIASAIGAADDQAADARKAGRIAKADLTTDMVREFTELQGTMGGIYARREGQPEAVWKAIAYQYLPVGVEPGLPPTKEQLGDGAVTWAALSIADKLDSVVGMFAAGERPTGTRDPFGMRRQVQGLLRVLVDLPELTGLKTDVGFASLIADTEAVYRSDAVKEAIGESENIPPFAAADSWTNELRAFFVERLRYLFERRGYRYDEINAVLPESIASSAEDIVPLAIRRKLEALQAMRQSADFEALAAAFKRVKNITKDVPVHADGHADASAREAAFGALREPAEQALLGEIRERRPKIRAAVASGDYRTAFTTAAGFRPSVDRFFSDVLVMAEDEAVRAARLGLVAELRDLILSLADISEIAGAAAPQD